MASWPQDGPKMALRSFRWPSSFIMHHASSLDYHSSFMQGVVVRGMEWLFGAWMVVRGMDGDVFLAIRVLACGVLKQVRNNEPGHCSQRRVNDSRAFLCGCPKRE